VIVLAAERRYIEPEEHHQGFALATLQSNHLHRETSESRAWTTLVELLSTRAALQANQTAFIFHNDGESDEERLTYAELDRSARQIAVELQRRCQTGDRVLLLYQPGLDFIRGFFGCLYAGMIAVPAFPPSSARNERSTGRLDAIVNCAAPAAILTASRTLELVMSTVSAIGHTICTDSLAAGSESQWRAPDLHSSTVACLQFTSGSTSTPKGVVLSHGNLLHNSTTIAEAFEHCERSVGCNWLPPYHDMGLIGGILQPLFVGFPHVMMSPASFLQKPLRWLAAISRYKATTCGAPDFAYDLCVKNIRTEDATALDLSSWDLAFCGAEPIRSRTLQRFAETFKPCGFRLEAFYPCYGLAEATLMVTGGSKAAGPIMRNTAADALRDNRLSTPDGSLARTHTLVGCGRARSDHRVVIVDPNTRRELPEECIGEIWVAGGGVAQGYWKQPELSLETFGATLAHGDGVRYLRTGDLGCLSGGELLVTGRIKDLVIVRGVKHYPHDIEQTVQSSHPALEGCVGAAFAIDEDAQERLVIAHEVQRAQRKTPPDEIVGAIRQHVGEHHHVQPHAIVLLKPGQIRRTSSGKIQRMACRAAYLNGEFETLAAWTAGDGALKHERPVEKADAPAIDPRTQALERWLQEQLAQAVNLSAEQIDPTEPFARYGLDSANAVSLAGAVSERVGQDLPATLFWDYPTIRSLADVLVKEHGVGQLTASAA